MTKLTGNGICDWHEGRVKGRDDVPDGVVADDAAEAEGGRHGREGRVGWSNTEQGQAAQAAGVDEGLLQLVVEVVWRGRRLLSNSCN